MKSENIGYERDVLRQIVKVSNAIRKKRRALRTGRDPNEYAMYEAFKPIVDPMEKLVNVSHAVNDRNKALVKNRG